VNDTWGAPVLAATMFTKVYRLLTPWMQALLQSCRKNTTKNRQHYYTTTTTKYQTDYETTISLKT
jgi:hypothetical protein